VLVLLKTCRILWQEVKKIYRVCSVPPGVKNSQPGNRLQRDEVEDGAGQSGRGGIHLEKICKKCVSVAVVLMMKLGVLPVTVPDEDNSSPSVPTETGGPKDKLESKWISLDPGNHVTMIIVALWRNSVAYWLASRLAD